MQFVSNAQKVYSELFSRSLSVSLPSRREHQIVLSIQLAGTSSNIELIR